MMMIISRFHAARVAAAIGLVAAVGCSAPPSDRRPATATPTAAAPTPTSATTIAVLGDSLGAGYGLPEIEAFPAVVQRLLRERGHDVQVLNASVSGDTTAGGVNRLEWDLQQTPEILVVELGGNDALRGQPLENIEANLRQIVRGAGERGARVLLLGMDLPTNYGPDYSREFASIYERVALEEGATLVPGFMREVGLDLDLLQPDGLHPTAEGQLRLARSLVPPLERMLEDRDDLT
ncbi:MAG: arylesterase [Acidobacteriota bacterium]